MTLIPIKMTPQRRVILETLRASRSHPSAEEVLSSVRRHLPRVSLGSVYRNLRVLREAGLVREIVTGEFRRYDAVTTPHAHFVCERCQRAYDLPEPVATAGFAGNVPEGFTVNWVDIEVRGVCAACGGTP
ncbi:MAG: transcriptional repressor [Armatimonadota bacterium]|nr:transcriptional repressor [Armatimonadota bacterium]MDR5696434.1 transcriptional repressor [Armatimonadota bacterium]